MLMFSAMVSFLTGTLSELEPSKKWIWSKVVVIVLLLCVALTALAFIASALWFIYRRTKHPNQWVSSSDRLTSYSSATNLMSQGTSSVTVYKRYVDSSHKSFIGKHPCSFLLLNSQFTYFLTSLYISFRFFFSEKRMHSEDFLSTQNQERSNTWNNYTVSIFRT